MAEEDQNQQHHHRQQTWGTWEELLLASAVKRHGFTNWDSVSMELQSRSSLPPFLTSAFNCQQKYHDLHLRFTSSSTSSPSPSPSPSPSSKQQQLHQNNNSGNNSTSTSSAANNQIIINNNIQQQNENDKDNDNDRDKDKEEVVNIPWLDELRKLRVAELKQEVLRYDVSIISLQLKVKRLEEEREKSLQQDDRNDDGGKPDLDTTRSENAQPDHQPDRPKTSEESDRENRSVNESNSTGVSGRKLRGGDEEEEEEEEEEDKVVRLEAERRGVLSESKGEESYEVGDSVTQLSSESASLGRKRKRRELMDGGDGGSKSLMIKSEPLIGFLEMIRTYNNYVSVFESRLQGQETEEYKNLVRQHLDLETIQTRLDQGSYSSSNLSFYRDLLLLFNNAIVFFPQSSMESQAAHQLRSLISNEMRKETQKSDSTIAQQSLPTRPKLELERSDSLLARQKSSAPIIVCRKRSSLSAKPSSSSSGPKIEQQQQQQPSNDSKPGNDNKQPVVEQSLLDMKSNEKPVTGARSSRRSNKNVINKGASTPSKKQNVSPGTKAAAADKSETPKTDKKKTEALALDKKKSAADFLKRIKKNSPVETLKKNNNNRGGGNGSAERKTDSNKKGQKGKERVLRKNGDRKQAKEENNTTKKSTGSGKSVKKGAEASRVSSKRGRETGGNEVAKRPRKRSRR